MGLLLIQLVRRLVKEGEGDREWIEGGGYEEAMSFSLIFMLSSLTNT